MAQQDPARKMITVAPAAGADGVFVVPAGETWHVVSMHFKLVTSGVVATRSAGIQVIGPDGATIICESAPGQVTQAASTTNLYNYQPGANGTGNQGNVQNGGAAVAVAIGSLPGDLWLNAGCKIQTAIAAKDAGDQLSQVSLWVEWF